MNRRRLLITGAAGSLALVGGVGAAGLARSGLMPSGAAVGGVQVGGLSGAQAAERLDQTWGEWLRSPVQFANGATVYSPTSADIGLSANYRGALLTALQPPRRATNTPVPIELDESRLRTWLGQLERATVRLPLDAALRFESGRPQIRPSRIGQRYDIDGAVRGLRSAFTGEAIHQTAIPIALLDKQPEITTAHAESALERARALIASPLVVYPADSDSGWQIRQAELAGALTARNDVGSIKIGLDHSRLPSLNRIDQFVGTASVPGDIEIDPETGKVSRFQLPVQGKMLNRAALADHLVEAALIGQTRVEAPISYQSVEWSGPLAEQLGIIAKLAEGSSSFAGSADYRITNIDAGSGHIDGTLVMPGETLSFNEALGPIEYERGYIDGLVIIEDSTRFAIGGGICQVSTTLFRAAFWAGFPILERHKHLYRVYYYELDGWPIGFDASIWQPDLDLQFVNNTGGAVLITRRYDLKRRRLAFELWGSPDGRLVEMTKAGVSAWTDQPLDQWIIRPDLPEETIDQTEHGARGAFATISRRVTLREEEPIDDGFHSSFSAWPNRYMISPDIARRDHPEAYVEWLRDVQSESDPELLHRFERPIGPLPTQEDSDEESDEPAPTVAPELLREIEELEAGLAQLFASRPAG